MYVLPKIDSEPFEVILCCLYLPFFENKNISLLSIYEDPSSEKDLWKAVWINRKKYLDIFSWSKQRLLAFFKSAVSLCSLDKQVHAMNDTACFYHSRS